MPYVEVEFSDLEFHETLGRGSAGSVYRGVWRSKDKVVALKKLNILESEAEVLSSLSHRNIVQFYGAVTVAPNFCIVLEYAECGSLYEYLKETSIDFYQILQWAKQIALGMNYLHYEAPITVIHRDLKSKNVVITADLTAKLCDFGSSRFHPHTTKLSLVGTFPWMAPEVIQQQPVTAACDVFSYSVVLWELLTHEVPYKGMEGLQVAWLVVAKEQRLTIPSSCPPVFADLMRKCWAQQPQHRLTFKEVLAVLDQIMEKGAVQEETDHFLSQKAEWKQEIEQKLEELKLVESALSSREQELKKKEQQLMAKEKHLESISSKTAENATGELHEVEHWSEQEVIDWLFSLRDGQLAEYAILFQRHHIDGRGLFLLSTSDLLQVGVLSLGHRKQLMEEVEKLRRDNHRLLHFPPLQHQHKEEYAPVFSEPVTEALVIIYGMLYRRGNAHEENRWKYFVDFDGPWPRLVQTVQFVFSSSIPSNIVTLSQPPYLSPRWVTGPAHPHCIVNYKDVVQRPKETNFQFSDSAAEAGEAGSGCTELCVRLSLQPRKTNHRQVPTPTTPLTPPTPAGGMPPTPPLASPQLSGIWADRADVIRPYTPTTSLTSLTSLDHNSPTRPRASSDVKLQNRQGQPPMKGAWSKPGSGVAVVSGGGGCHGAPPAKQPTNLQSPPIRKSMSGPAVFGRGRGPTQAGGRGGGHGDQRRIQRITSDSNFERASQPWPRDGPRDDRRRDGQRHRGRRQEVWHRVNSGGHGQVRGRGGGVEEEEEVGGLQRSFSTTQAHQYSKPQQHKKPFSEPS